MAMQNPLFTLNQSLFFHIIKNSEIYIYIFEQFFVVFRWLPWNIFQFLEGSITGA